jgi:small GTP-binding protein
MFAYKKVMIGDFGVGKTSLVRRFVDNSFSEDYISSIGVSISKKLITTPNGDSTMMLWDTEGKTEFNQIFKQYLVGAKGYIIVADLTRPQTLTSIKEHLKLCLNVVKDAPVCIALNKSDLEHQNNYSEEEIKALSQNIIGVYKTSAQSGDIVNEIFGQINSTIVNKGK